MVDYGAGNLRSLRAAFERAGAEVAVSDDAERVARAELVVIPGVGQAAAAMEALRERGLVDAILAGLRDGSHLFGVCVGMQLLFARSEEGETAGLGLLPGQRDAARPARAACRTWAGTTWSRRRRIRSRPPFRHPATSRTATPCRTPRHAACWPSTPVERGGFASLVGEGRVAGAQFHPERSGAAGAEFLRAVVRWAGDAA